MNFVIDNSIVMRWLLRDASPANQRYSEQVLTCLAVDVGIVPSLWWLELANLIARSERRGLVQQAESEQFMQLLKAQSLQERQLAGPLLLDKTLALARQYGIGSYDAGYLVLAMHLQLPLATLDTDMRKAAERMGIALYPVPQTY